MNLRAQNLVAFSEMAAGVDDSTWLFHLLNGDYSEWFRAVIKDEDLADDVATVEREASGLTPLDSRRMIHDAIDRRTCSPSNGTAVGCWSTLPSQQLLCRVPADAVALACLSAGLTSRSDGCHTGLSPLTVSTVEPYS